MCLCLRVDVFIKGEYTSENITEKYQYEKIPLLTCEPSIMDDFTRICIRTCNVQRTMLVTLTKNNNHVHNNRIYVKIFEGNFI